jgi:hypothetical protein
MFLNTDGGVVVLGGWESQRQGEGRQENHIQREEKLAEETGVQWQPVK